MEDMWRTSRVVGKKRGIPATSCPPLGDNWDGGVALSAALIKSGKSGKIYLGVFKARPRKGAR